MKQSSGSSWLLSFSDLLFILVAFFIWRQQFLSIDTPQMSSAIEKSKTASESSIASITPIAESMEVVPVETNAFSLLLENKESLFQKLHRDPHLEHALEVTQAWFSGDGTITMYGATQLHSLIDSAKGFDAVMIVSLTLGQGQGLSDEVSRQLAENLKSHIQKVAPDKRVDLRLILAPKAQDNAVKLLMQFG